VDHYLKVRLAVEAGTVIASGAAPILMGVLIDVGIPLSFQALACGAYAFLASVATIRVIKMPREFRSVDNPTPEHQNG